MAGDIETGNARRRNRWSLAIWGTAAVLLSLPAIAMQLEVTGVDWGPEDFIVMGILFAIACGSYEVIARISSNTAYRAASAIAIVTAFLTVWVNLAVGMLGDEGNPANLWFGGVLLVAMAGVILAGFRARGMARAMEAAALGQALMVVYALVAGYAEVALFIGFFVLPWLLSAQLFKKAAGESAA